MAPRSVAKLSAPTPTPASPSVKADHGFRVDQENGKSTTSTSSRSRGRVRKRGVNSRSGESEPKARSPSPSWIDFREIDALFSFRRYCNVPFRKVFGRSAHYRSEEHSRIMSLIMKNNFSFSWSPISVDNFGRLECKSCNFQYRKPLPWNYHLRSRYHYKRARRDDPRLQPIQVEHLIE